MMLDEPFENDVTALRLRLRTNGFKPVPITGPQASGPSAGKRPKLPNWHMVCRTADEAAVNRWMSAMPDCTNTGILTGVGGLIGVDIDVLNGPIVDEILNDAEIVLGASEFLRIGKAPKALLLYRVSGEPNKVATPEFLGPNGDKAQVEILGMGQQFVGFGIHPDTKAPYTWPLRSPLRYTITEVPETSMAAVQEFLECAEIRLRRAGYHAKAKEKAKSTKVPPTPAFGEDSSSHIATQPELPKPTFQEVEEALNAIPNNHDWHGWVRIGAAIFSAVGTAGERLFMEWSAKSWKSVPENTTKKWHSFSTSPMTKITHSSLFHEARQNGWKGKPHKKTTNKKNSPEAHYELTEDAVSLAFNIKYDGKLKFCHDTHKWYLWNGVYWQQNRDHIAFDYARDLARSFRQKIEDISEGTLAAVGKTAFASGVEKFAQRDRAFAVTADIWDQNPFLLGTPAGTVDLKTGNLHSSSAEDYITKVTAVVPTETADCPNWYEFLRQATGNDVDLIRFLGQWCGYCLTGSTQEHALLFIYGPGGNGKSVFLNTVSSILGHHAVTAPMDAFSASTGERHPTDLAMLRGARLVTATETEEGRAWAEAKIKQMTGGDPISARFMRQDFFTFRPCFKITIAGNHKPTLKNVDEAARRRFNIVPFVHKPEKPDRDLEVKLRAEWPGILRWMIGGCIDWQQNGLLRPAIVIEATEEYFAAQDTIGRWVKERCILAPHLVEKPGRLLTDCKAWAAENGEVPPSGPQFRSATEKMSGLRYVTVKGARLIRGVGLRAEEAVGCG